MARSFTSLVGVDSPFDPSFKLVTSPFISPVSLAALRVLFGLYLLVALTTSLVRRAVVTHDAEAFLTYFTNLTGIGLCAYFFHAGLMTALYARRVGQRGAEKASYPLQSWPRTLQVLHMILLASIRTLPLIVTIVFWIFLAGDGPLKTPWGRYLNLSVHVFNSVFALFEIICTHTPLSKWFNIVFMVLILGGYVGVAYITHATQGFYTYSFLDPSKGAKLAIYIVGIPVAEAIVFALVNGIIALRARFAPKPTPPTAVSVPSDGESMTELERSDKGSLHKRQQLSSPAAAAST